MLDLTGYGRLAEFTKLTDRMLAQSSKETVAEAARLLAAQLAHYQRKHGALPSDETIDLLAKQDLTEDEAGRVADGLENLAVALATVPDDDGPAATMQ
ncbi:MAG: hypothetical protein ACREUW_03670 [Burkholderiales bacterium]